MKVANCKLPVVAVAAALIWAQAATAGADADADRFDDPAYNIEAWVKLDGDTAGRLFYRKSRMVDDHAEDGRHPWQHVVAGRHDQAL